MKGNAITPRYSELAFRGFDMLLAPWRATHMQRAPLPRVSGVSPDRPLLIAANHTSWWDGFLLRDLHRAMRPATPMYTVMSRAELERRPFFRLLGCVPLDARSPGGVRALLRALEAAAAAQPACSVIYFPQGRIWPSGRRPLGFHRGIELVARALAPCTVLPVALHVEPLNHAAPTAFVLPAAPIHCDAGAHVGAADLEAAVTARLDALADILSTHGEDAVRHCAEIS